MKKLLISVLSVLMMVLTISAIYTNVFADSLNGWQKENGKWYYYEEGYKWRTGIQELEGKLWMFDENSALIDKVGWQKQTDTWYDEYDKPHYTDTWYYIRTGGSLARGWTQIGKTWYWFYDTGEMFSDGTCQIDGKVYMFDENGAMVTKSGWYNKTYVDSWDGTKTTAWFFLNGNGTCKTGWMQSGNTWYYFNEYGRMTTSPMLIDKKIYCFDKSGAWIKPNGWYSFSYAYGAEVSTYWFYFKNGYGVTGWIQLGNTWYWFDEYGTMVNYPTEVDGKINYFDKSGKWSTPNGWISVKNTYSDGSSYTYWYYFENGYGVTGFKDIGGKTYYFSPYSGTMHEDGAYEINGKTYCFDKSGAQVKSGWFEHIDRWGGSNGEEQIDDQWYYVGKDGTAVTGMQTIGGVSYYFESWNCKMVANTLKKIEDDTYAFNKNGAMIKKAWYMDKWSNWEEDKKIEYVEWYYLGEDGKALKGFQTIGGVSYCFDDYDGRMRKDEVVRYWDDENNTVYAVNENGVVITNSWYDEEQYRFNEKTGKEETVIVKIYLGKDGKAVSGLQKIDGEMYYFNEYSFDLVVNEIRWIDEDIYGFGSNGKMIKKNWYKYIGLNWDDEGNEKEEIQWYYFGTDGKAVSGIQTINGNTYYFNPYMKTDSVVFLEDITYAFDSNGHMIKKNWYKTVDTWNSGDEQITEIKWYYLGADGKALKGLQDIDGDTYYFDEWSGSMIANQERYIDGVNYVFNSSGRMVKNSWYKRDVIYTDPETGVETPEVVWYHIGANGAPDTGWYQEGSTWYYLNSWDGSMVVKKSEWVGDKKYYFNESGRMIRNTLICEEMQQWNVDHYDMIPTWSYYGQDGAAISGWKTINGKQYYFMAAASYNAATGIEYIDGEPYKFDENGVLIGKVEE